MITDKDLKESWDEGTQSDLYKVAEQLLKERDELLKERRQHEKAREEFAKEIRAQSDLYEKQLKDAFARAEAYREGFIKEVQGWIDCDEMTLKKTPTEYVDAEAARIMKEKGG